MSYFSLAACDRSHRLDWFVLLYSLDLELKPRGDLPEGAHGEAWQVHGGGFYHIKFLVAPSQMPSELTWFKWEAYTTWLSGFVLMVIVYYLDAELFLVDKSVLDLTPLQAGLFSFGSLALAWLLYEGVLPADWPATSFPSPSAAISSWSC